MRVLEISSEQRTTAVLRHYWKELENHLSELWDISVAHASELWFLAAPAYWITLQLPRLLPPSCRVPSLEPAMALPWPMGCNYVCALLDSLLQVSSRPAGAMLLL